MKRLLSGLLLSWLILAAGCTAADMEDIGEMMGTLGGWWLEAEYEKLGEDE